ncbi:MAG: hypothetical protein GY859_05605 [Desulfobacterales bacterium]|nr:hypothetical protein [Desulfobacterales bacterium]
MSNLIEILKMVPILIAALLLGNWFMSEVKAARLKGKPSWKPYLSPPGLIIIAAVVILPILMLYLKK